MGSIDLPETVTEIGPGAFQFCLGLTHVTIPKNLSILDMSVFQQCWNLESVTFPSGISSIQSSAFYNCNHLTDVYYTGSAEAWNAVEIAPNNNEYVINATKHFNTTLILESGECGADGNNVTWTLNEYSDLSITGTGAMADYDRDTRPPWRWITGKTTEVTVSEGVTRIGSMAFYFITNLRQITIPSTVESIGEYAFDGCISLETIVYGGNAAQWANITIQETGNSALNTATVQCTGPDYPTGSCGENVIWVLGDNGTLTISGAGEMYNYDSEWDGPWFDYRDQVRTIVIEDGVTAIGECAFYRHTQVQTVRMADSVTLIGEGAFRGNTALTDIQFSNGLVTIGNCAFMECETLSDVTLPDGLETIGHEAFLFCNLSEIAVPAGTETRTWDLFYSGMDGQDYLCHVTLPESVTDVGFGAFCENPIPRDLPDYILPEDLTTIEAEAFSGSNPRFVWIPEGVTTIGSNAFASCANLKYVYIPFGCESIGDNAFPAGTKILGIRIYDLEPCAAQEYADQNEQLTFIELEAPFSGNG